MTRKIIGVCCIAAGLLLGCSNGSGSSTGSSSNTTPITQEPASSKSTTRPALYIDTSTAVPVVNGSPTEGVLYVHNTSNTTVNGIKFSLYHETTNGPVSRILSTLSLKSQGIEDDKGFRLLDAENCQSIQAGGSCAVKFITPAVEAGSQGSTVVKMNYTDAENKSIPISKNGPLIINPNAIKSHDIFDAKFTTGTKLLLKFRGTYPLAC